MKKVIAGSRDSILAMVQTNMVVDHIKANAPDVEPEILSMKTTGDKILDKKLEEIGGKGLFVKELDLALREGRSDFSVHSLKDLPYVVPEDLPVIGYSKREDPRDVLVMPEGVALEDIDLSKPIGCSSNRRILQLRKLFPGATVQSVRGNVQTRLRKLDEGGYCAIILAAAGLKRLGLEGRISRYFSEEEMIPAAGQGIVCVQGRAGEEYDYLDGFFDENATACAEAERAFVRTLNGSCTSPIAAHAVVKDDRDREPAHIKCSLHNHKSGCEIKLTGLYYDEVSGKAVIGSITGPAAYAEGVGYELAVHLNEITGNNAGKCGTAISGGQALASADNTNNYAETEIEELETIEYKKGKVYLLGAGPSDVGLFTKKGMETLAEADIVVYDSLVGNEILSLIPDTAELIDVGKRAANHKKSQWQINEILLEEALKGKTVVRLKGGDPFMFGRGGEELELLCQHNIEYEVIPGVTSAIAVPAYNGIPVTHRDYTSSVHIITGHKREGCDYDIDFEALVRTKGTLVFLMGIGALPDIMEGLLKGGIDPDMPAAVLQQGTTAYQKRVIATVKTLEEEVIRQGIETPAIIVVGKVCSLADEFGWMEKRPLFGERICVTRPVGRSSELAAKLKKLGAEVIQLPSIVTSPVSEPAQIAAVKDALSKVADYDILAFTSPYGVRAFMDFMKENDMDIRALAGAKIAAIGAGTAKELAASCLKADIVPAHYDASCLGKAIAENCQGGENILIPRALIGSPELIEELNKVEGVKITDLPVYDTTYAECRAVDLEGQLAAGKITMCMFTSASTVRGFMNMCKGADISGVKAVCIGAQTEAEALKAGFNCVTADNATIDKMVECALKVHEAR